MTDFVESCNPGCAFCQSRGWTREAKACTRDSEKDTLYGVHIGRYVDWYIYDVKYQNSMAVVKCRGKWSLWLNQSRDGKISDFIELAMWHFAPL